MSTSRQLNHYWTLPTQQKFLSRFSQLLEQGFSIAQALDVMTSLFKKEAIDFMLNCCASGQSFATTLEACHFEKRIVYIVRCSEEAGSLLQGLQKSAQYSDYHLQSKTELNKKLRYPVSLFALIIVILASVYFFFFPQLDSFYNSFNIEGDQSLLNTILLILGIVLALFVLIGCFAFLTLKWHGKRFQLKMKYILFHWPLLSQLFQKVFSYYFSSQWLVFLNCGLPLKESLLMMRNFETIPMIQLIIYEFQTQLEAGVSLEDVFHQSPYFTPYFKLIMKHALQIGQVHTELGYYTKSELQMLTTMLNNTFKIIQFTFLMLIGVIIILIYLSLLQPVFQMAQLI